MIQDLNDIITKTQKGIKNELRVIKDIKFNAVFIERFKKVSGWNIEFNDYSAKILTSGGKYVLAPSSWFLIAAKLDVVLSELIKYKQIFDFGYNSIGSPGNNPDTWAFNLKNAALPQPFLQNVTVHFALTPTEQAYINSFMTNYAWWSGGKSIGRGDFHRSPLMQLTGLLAESSGYVIEIAEVLAKDTLLAGQMMAIYDESRGYLLFGTDLKEFARQLFLFLKREYSNQLFSLFSPTGNAVHNGVNNYDKLGLPFLNDVFARFPTAQSDQQLRSGTPPMLRFFPDDFVTGTGFTYLNTQWVHNGNPNDLTFVNLVKFINKNFSYYSLEYANGLYLLNFAGPRNKIFYGAPGTGKSYQIQKQTNSSKIIRITFNPEYTYGQFVGTYKPVSEKGDIKYEVVPGPLIKAILFANQEKEKPFYLVIEEINRANVSAVFGDIFQLLDRDFNGESEYGIILSADLMKYLQSSKLISDINQEVKLPANLHIWATMNSADQGVFPLDTAFKRRWSFEYIQLNQGESALGPVMMVINKSIKVSWNLFRRNLNDFLSDHDVQEDKLIGPFFLNKTELSTSAGFAGKLVLYLWDDILKHRKRSILFKPKTLSEVNGLIEANTNPQSFFQEFFSDTFLTPRNVN